MFVIHDSYDPNVIDIFKPPYEINQTGFAGFDVKIIILWRNQVYKFHYLFLFGSMLIFIFYKLI